jgi:hypothetical protein
MSYTQQEKAIVQKELAIVGSEQGIPLLEVFDRISENKNSSNNDKGGFIKYEKVIGEAKTRFPFQPKSVQPSEGNPDGKQLNDALQGLTTATAEAITYGGFKDMRTNFGTPKSLVFHDPMAQENFVEQLPLGLQLIGIQARLCFGKYTPDLLVISSPQTVKIGNTVKVELPAYGDLVNLDDYKSKVLKDTGGIEKTVVSPVEITVTRKPEDIKKKIDKFGMYKSELLKSNTGIKYLPVLVLDYDQYMSIKDSQKKIICKAMKKVGGVIILKPQLLSVSRTIAKSAANRFTPQIRKINGLSVNPTIKTDILTHATKSNVQKNSLVGEFIGRFKERFQKLTKKPPSKSKIEKPASKENFADTHQKMAAKLKNNPNFFREMGINEINPNHIDLMIATYALRNNLEANKILEQSPARLAERPAVAQMKINRMIYDAQILNKQANFNTSASQEIIHYYDKEKAKGNTTSNTKTEQQKNINKFDKIADVIKENSTAFNKVGLDVSGNREHLLIAIALVGIHSGKNPKENLWLSPEYIGAKTPEEGEAILAGVIKKAESVVQEEEKPKAELMAKNKQPNQEYQL